MERARLVGDDQHANTISYGDRQGHDQQGLSRAATSRSARPMRIAVFVLLASASLAAQQGTTKGEFRTYGGDLGSTRHRHAPLDQINPENFNSLEVAWRFRTESLGSRPDYNLQTTPLMINGVLYATAGEHRTAIALNAATGELLWVHRLEEGRRAPLSSPALRTRGRLLDRRRRGRANLLRHHRLPAGRPRCKDRPGAERLLRRRRRRSQE